MFSKQGLSFVIFGVLGWLLSPEDFGVLSTAMILIMFLDSFIESGFSSALIQRQNVTTKHFSLIFVVNVIVGALLTLIGLVVAHPAANYFATPLLAPVIQVLSVGFFVNALSLTQVALAQKNLLFKPLAMRDTIATIVGGALGITLAILGFGVWSLVAQTLATYLINTIVLWSVTKWRPRLREASFSVVRELWPYSSRLFVFNIIKFFAQNTEKFFILVMLGTVALGYYTFAFKFTVLPITMFVGSIGIYLFPKFSRLQTDPATVKHSYLLTTRVIQAVVTPLVLALIVSAPIIVPTIWQEKWLTAISILQILAVLAYAQALISPVGQLLKAFNRPHWLLYWSIGVTVVLAASLPLAARQFDLAGVAWTLTIVYGIGLPVNYWLVKKLLPITLREVGTALLPSLLSAAVAAAVFMTITALLPNRTWLQLITGYALAGATYLGLLYWSDRSSITVVTKELQRFASANATGITTPDAASYPDQTRP